MAHRLLDDESKSPYASEGDKAPQLTSLNDKTIELLEGLTKKQRIFLLARRNTRSDKQASEQANVAYTSAMRWKKDSAFRRVYDAVLEMQHPEQVEEVLAAATDDEQINLLKRGELEDIVRQQLTVYAQQLPRVFERLFDIVINGNDTAALKAMETVGKWFSITPEILQAEQLSTVQQQILKWTQINVYRGEEGGESDHDHRKADIEATFRALPAE